MDTQFYEEHFLYKVRRFLSDIQGEQNPASLWKVKNYRTGKVNQLGKSGIDRVLETLLKYNINWRNEIFFSLRSWYPKVIEPKKKSTNGKPPKRKWFPKPFRCFCIDVDCGTESKEVHYQRIEECRLICEQRGIPFTHVVISRNGFHFIGAFQRGSRKDCGYRFRTS